ncbi:stimulated by retinoic acid gene 8 protein homolog [Trichosurus vulpecula]|uniref:stimulated by retinoic acid gene 8 protein homolog n=1 Tax=Trichosurus vulpecula TaxID=9337 RepID=UPI00186B26A4|nr:stimulated by retinoic acid gene 8 protein homolog [Trichosurus vulpecula]
METSEDFSNLYVRVTPRLLAELQELEPRVLRRRLSQARHRATLARLFNNLRKTVFSPSDSTASKWQVLRKAKNHIQELEQTLDHLLKMKESFNLEDGNASTLEEVKEEYARMYSNNHSMMSEATGENGSTIWYLIQEFDGEAVEEEEEGRRGELSHSSPVTSSPDLMEFERYLYFYKQSVDLLIQNGVISPEQVTLPIVSMAISHLWQELPEEKRGSILQACIQRQSALVNAEAPCQEPPRAAEDSVKNSSVGSEEANGSLVSTPEEILFEDAFDVATGVSSPSSVFAGCSSENPEENNHLYVQIVSFLKGLFCANTQLPQEAAIPLDDETVMLRCTETFDDEDL